VWKRNEIEDHIGRSRKHLTMTNRGSDLSSDVIYANSYKSQSTLSQDLLTVPACT